MRVLLLGARGMLAHDLIATAAPTVRLEPLSRTALDITDDRAVAKAVQGSHPEMIINTAAYTRVDAAESAQDLSFRVNATSVGHLGSVASEVGALVVHFSTDYVFDGTSDLPYTEEDVPHPVNVYGATKLAGEDALRQSGADFLIIRAQWLFGLHGRSFPRTMWERALDGTPTRVVNDQVGRPTYTRDLASSVWRLLSLGARGTFHVANTGIATWHQLALRVFARLGREDLLTACATSDYPTPARRPSHSLLDTRKAEMMLGQTLPRWDYALERLLDEVDRSSLWKRTTTEGPKCR